MKGSTRTLMLCLAAGMAIPAMAALDTVTSAGVSSHGFPLKTDVYIATCSVTDGAWYFKITAPGTTTTLGSGAFSVLGGNISTGTGVGSCGGTSLAVAPFSDSDRPNHGCVYKVWISQDPAFPNNNSDTKTFKTCNLADPPPPDSVLTGVKYYDSNRNGVQDGGETPLAGVQIDVTHGLFTDSVVTDANGVWLLVIPGADSFKACENKTVAPFTSGTWEQSGPVDAAANGAATANGGCWSGPAGQDFIDLNFGNVAKVTGTKYYDSDGVLVGGEPTIDGFKISMCEGIACPGGTTASTTTGPNGGYSFYLSQVDSTYRICEPNPLPNAGLGKIWKQTGPLNLATPFPANTGTGTAAGDTVKCWAGSGPVSGLYVTNVCQMTGGRSHGFFENKNGEAAFNTNTAGNLAILVALHLRNLNGTDFNPATYAQFKTWSGAVNATNMAYMLSVQMTAARLSVSTGFLDGTTIVDVTGFGIPGPQTLTVNALIAAADALLAANGLTTTGSPDRALQEKYKNALDALVNNLLPLTPGSCTPAANPPVA